MDSLDEEDSGAGSGGITGRIGGLFELVTTLDRRLLSALNVFDRIQETLTAFDELAEQSDEIAGDVRARLAALDERVNHELERLSQQTDSLAQDARERVVRLDDRLNRDLDDLRLLADRGAGVMKDVEERIDALDRRIHRDLDDFKNVIETKLADFDLLTFVTRFDRMEQALLNIEAATTNLDRAVEGSVGSMPEFVQNRVREESRKLAPRGARDVPPE